MKATTTAVMFGKASDEWATPQGFFDKLDAEFGFGLDAAATALNSKCLRWLTTALEMDCAWPHEGRPVWLNPPYSKCREFIWRAWVEAQRGATVVCLVPSRTDTKWWHLYVWDEKHHQPQPGVEIRFVKGRLKFGQSQNSAPFPSVVIVFRPVSA